MWCVIEAFALFVLRSRGRRMFKDSTAESLLNSAQQKPRERRNEAVSLQRYCVTESFTANLATGAILLGEQTTAIHGLTSKSCGLLALTRCYSAQDRLRVLDILERASRSSNRFSFNTTVERPNGDHIPLLCTGESLVHSNGHTGHISGVFVFSKNMQH